MNDIHLEIGWATLWRIFSFVALIMVFYYARQVFGILLISIVVSLGFEPVLNFLESRKLNRVLGAIFIFVVAIFLLSTIFYFLVPVIITEAGDFLQQFNKTIATIFGLSISQAILKGFSLSLDKTLNVLSAANISIPNAISAILGRLVYIFATIMITFYLMIVKEGTERLLRVVLPDVYERPALIIFNRFKQKIYKWFSAQLALSFIVGVLVSIGLWILGVKYFLIIGLLAAVFEIVPIIGPIITGLVAFLVAVSDSLSLGLYALGFFFLLQQLENHILAPLVMGKALDVHPVIIIVSLLAGGQIAGFIGIVLAVPTALIIEEIFSYFSERKSSRAVLNI
jgi:predicted PurR-regulated permease PerM